MYTGKPIYLLNPLNSTRELTLAIEAAQNEWLQLHSTATPLHLHHYTTKEGLNGILRSRSFWSTHISSLNDPTEIQYGKAIIAEALEGALKSETDDAIVKMLKGLTNYVEVYDKILYDTYITCFCEDEDLASQWREYAGNGDGYSIRVTFDAATQFSHDLDDLEKGSYIILRKVIYDRHHQTQLVSEYLQRIRRAAAQAIQHFMQIWGELPDVWESQAALQTSNLLFDMMFSFKDAKYQDEHEWRLVKAMQPDFRPEIVKERERDGEKHKYIPSYVFYRDLAIYSPIDCIRIGPSATSSDSDKYLSSIIDDILVDEHPIYINVDNLEFKRSKL